MSRPPPVFLSIAILAEEKSRGHQVKCTCPSENLRLLDEICFIPYRRELHEIDGMMNEIGRQMLDKCSCCILLNSCGSSQTLAVYSYSQTGIGGEKGATCYPTSDECSRRFSTKSLQLRVTVRFDHLRWKTPSLTSLPDSSGWP